MKSNSAFFTLLARNEDVKHIKLLIESLRTFGGKFKDYPIWIFISENLNFNFSIFGNVQTIPLNIPEDFRNIIFSNKVFAAAQAEEMADQESISSLIWFGSSGFIVQPPDQLDLGMQFDAAFRPVHHRNVGIMVNEKLDDFWREIYDFVSLEDSNIYLETFVESEKILPYFNSHLFSINPKKGILRKWKEYFCRFFDERLSNKSAFSDQPHQIFLHQALLSALLIKHLDWNRIRILSPDYSYPLHLHHQVPQEKQPQNLNELVCPVYEEGFKFPDTLNGLEVNGLLKSWLNERMGITP